MSSKRMFAGDHLVEEIAVRGGKVARLRRIRCGLEVPLTEADKLLSTPCKGTEKAVREGPKAAGALKRELVGGLMGFGVSALAGILSAVSALAMGISTGSAAGHGLNELLMMAFTFFVSKLELLYLVIRAWLASNTETILAMAAAMNLPSVLALYVDKRQAEEGGRRIPERSLVRYLVAGGGLRALAAVLLIRHKTKYEGLLMEIAIYTAPFMAFIILAVVGP